MPDNSFLLDKGLGRVSRIRAHVAANFGNLGCLEMPLARAQLGGKGDH